MAGWLVHPRLPFLTALIAVALCLPALGTGFQLDDYFQRMVLLERTVHETGKLEAFALMRGENRHLHEYVDWGFFPWWTARNLRLAFFRYVTMATAWLDYQLWPDSAPLMHLHSLLWLGALVVLVGVFYRRIMGPTVTAGLAVLLYSMDEAHAGAAAWLANRNALVATFFGVASLVAHDRWRSSGRRWGAWGGPLLLALALGSGEMALGAFAYLGAYALFLDREGRARGCAALSGHAAVAGLWALVYWIGGYGARGSGLYLDPLRDTVAYLAALPERLPMLLLGQWTAISADAAWLLPPEKARTAWIVALIALAALTAVFVPLIRRDRRARFWTAGMLLSLLPVAATFPSNRLLFFAGVGAMGLAAQLLGEAFAPEGAGSRSWRIGAQAVGVLLVLQHLVLAPLTMPLGAAFVRDVGEPVKRAVASLPADEGIRERAVVVVNTPDYLTYVALIPALRSVEGTPWPRRLRALSAGPAPITLTRLDAETVRVGIEGGLYAGPLGELFRSRKDPLPPGAVTQLTGLTVRVEEADEAGVPLVVDYRFSVPLEDPSLHWVRWEGGVYVPWAPPPPGERVTLPAARGTFEEIAELLPF